MSDFNRLDRIRQLSNAVWLAQDDLERALTAYYKPGSRVTWKWSKSVHFGEVVMTNASQVKVRNHATGREYWIGCEWLRD